jgi:hypothetical protein
MKYPTSEINSSPQKCGQLFIKDLLAYTSAPGDPSFCCLTQRGTRWIGPSRC